MTGEIHNLLILLRPVIILFLTIPTDFMLVKQELAKKVFLTAYFNNLDIKTKNQITPLKAISPNVLKFRFLPASKYILVSKRL